MLSDSEVRDYLNRMVPLQEVAAENIERLNEIKRDARADGMNRDAINALLPVLSKYPHDKGASVLNEVIRYAEVFGAGPIGSQANAITHRPRELGSNADVPQSATAEVPSPAISGRRSTASAPLRLSTQVVAALSLSIGLLWLLN